MQYLVDSNNIKTKELIDFGSLIQAKIFALREIVNTDISEVWVLCRNKEYGKRVKLKIKQCTE